MEEQWISSSMVIMLVEVSIVVLIISFYPRCFSEFICYCRCGKTEEIIRIETLNRFTPQLSMASQCIIPNCNHILFTTRLTSLIIFMVSWYHIYFFNFWIACALVYYFVLVSWFSFREVMRNWGTESYESTVKSIHYLFHIVGSITFLNMFLAYVNSSYSINVMMLFIFDNADSEFEREFNFWNTSLACGTAFMMLVELSLNKFYVRYDYLSLNLLWLSLVTMSPWLSILGGDTDYSFYMFKQITFVIIIDIVIYSIWYGFSELKFFLYSRYFRSIDTQIADAATAEDIDENTPTLQIV